MESRANAPHQMLLIDWLPKVTDDAIPHSLRPGALIGVSRHQNRRGRAPGLDEASVKLLDHRDQ